MESFFKESPKLFIKAETFFLKYFKPLFIDAYGK